MFFSSKISNSILSYCDREGINREVLYNQSTWPEEFLKDPSCWLESHQLEDLLRFVEREIGDVEKIALQSPKLHAWGPLDSVLKLMGRPRDILSQPDRFLCYFISPPPPIVFLERDEDSVSFRIPISSEEYPLVTRYLKGAFESLPIYVGKSPAQVVWSENVVSLSWVFQQETLLEDTEKSNVNPKLVTNLMHSIEKSQKEIEEKNRELQNRLVEIQRLRISLEEARARGKNVLNIESDFVRDGLGRIGTAVSKLQDYLVRAQQLITVLVGTERTNPIIQGALRKVDWEHVIKEFPRLSKEANEQIQKIKESIREDEEPECLKSNPSAQEKFWIAEGNPL